MLTTFDQKLAEYLNGYQVNGWPVGNLILVMIALVLSMLLCGAVGLEREIRGRSAGLRTHLLVGMGSCVVMIVSIYGFPSQDSASRDVARLAAQVVSGVGFLGAGAIIYHNAGAKGLTTAGTIWLSMAIGLACGSMNFILAFGATVIIMFVLLGLRGLERRIAAKNPTVIVAAPAELPVLSMILSECEKFNCTCTNIVSERIIRDGKELIQITFKAYSKKPDDFDTASFSESLRLRTSAQYVQVMDHR